MSSKNKKPVAILTADTHLREDQPVARMDDYQISQFTKFEFLLKEAKRLKVPIFHGGDIFDKAKCSKGFENKIIDIINQYQVELNIIPGNHDLPYHKLSELDNSSLGILSRNNFVHVFQNELDKVYHFAFPSFILGMVHTFLYKEKEDGISIDGKFLGSKAKTFLKKHSECDVILSGDNHQHFIIEEKGRLLINPGSMMRMTANQEGFSPYFIILYEDQSYKVEEFPFEVGIINRDHLEKKENYDERMEKFVSKISGEGEEISLSFTKNVYNYIEGNKVRKPVAEIIKEVIEE